MSHTSLRDHLEEVELTMEFRLSYSGGGGEVKLKFGLPPPRGCIGRNPRASSVLKVWRLEIEGLAAENFKFYGRSWTAGALTFVRRRPKVCPPASLSFSAVTGSWVAGDRGFAEEI